MYVNGEAREIPMAATVFNNRTFLPLRTIAEALGQTVSWDERGIIVVGSTAASTAVMDEIWVKL